MACAWKTLPVGALDPVARMCRPITKRWRRIERRVRGRCLSSVGMNGQRHATIAILTLVLIGCSSNGAGGDNGGAPVTYTVTYNANGADEGVVPTDLTRYEAGVTVTASANTGGLQRDGYPFFIGWNTAADGSGEEYTPGETFAMPAGNLTLYALWLDVHDLIASETEVEDSFGYSVAVVGSYVFVGSPGDDEAARNAGAVYIFRYGEGNDWNRVTKLMAPNSSEGAFFGISVDAHGDYVIVGAEGVGANTGAAYIFRRTGSTAWDAGTEINHPDDDPGNFFGGAVAIDGDYAIVGVPGDGSGTGSAFIFRRTGTNAWDDVTQMFSGLHGSGRLIFGASVAIDGDYAVVGAPGNVGGTFDSGAALVFRRTGLNAWDDRTRLVATDGATERAYFGSTVAIDGTHVVVGASGDTENGADSGAAYVFARTGANAWNGTKIIASDGTDGDYFGGSVAIRGTVAVVGAVNREISVGAVYIFRHEESGRWNEKTILTVADADQYLGRSVALSDRHIVTGAPGDDSDEPGTAHVRRYR